MEKRVVFIGILVSLLMVLSIAHPSNATTSNPINNAGWAINQAAGQSQGTATKVIACGTFSLTVSSSSNPTASSGTFSGTITFKTAYDSEELSVPSSPVEITGTWLRNQATGVLMVRFSSMPSILTGSFTSPSSLPEPSTPSPPQGCEPLASGLFGFIQSPIVQQSEGMFIYWNQQVTEL